MCGVLIAECAVLDAELASIEREVSDIRERRNRREAEECTREEEIHQLEQQLVAIKTHIAEQTMLEVTLAKQLQEWEATQGKSADVERLKELQTQHEWHLNHRLPQVREAAREAERGAGGAVDDTPTFTSSASSSTGSNRGSGRKRQRTQQQSAARPRVTHSMQTLGGHGGGGGQFNRYAKVVQVTADNTSTLTDDDCAAATCALLRTLCSLTAACCLFDVDCVQDSGQMTF